MGIRESQSDPKVGELLREASIAASSAMAHTLAHHINNPLQSITNSVFLAMHSTDASSRDRHLEQASDDLRILSRLVGELLLLHQPTLPPDSGEPLLPPPTALAARKPVEPAAGR